MNNNVISFPKAESIEDTLEHIKKTNPKAIIVLSLTDDKCASVRYSANITLAECCFLKTIFELDLMATFRGEKK